MPPGVSTTNEPAAPATPTEAGVLDILDRLGVDSKTWYESKTMAFNLLSVIVAIAFLFGFDAHVAPEYVEEVVGFAVMIVSVVNMGLRLVSRSPVR